jgi:glyoxylase-like metal-dependent hydrolase (beta-lactamase superfamily II)
VIPFVRDFDFAYGRRDQVSPLIQRVIAHNPGPFTFTGTGTYIVGRAEPGAQVAVIVPGPLDEAHLAALLTAVEGRVVSHVLVTHTHRDHAPLARPFADRTGATILAAQPPLREPRASWRAAPKLPLQFTEPSIQFANTVLVGSRDATSGPNTVALALATLVHLKLQYDHSPRSA